MSSHIIANITAIDPLLPVTPEVSVDQSVIWATAPYLWLEGLPRQFKPREGDYTALVERRWGYELRGFLLPGKVMPERVNAGDLDVLDFGSSTGALRVVDPLDPADDPDLLHPTCNSFAWVGRYGSGEGGTIFGNRIFSDQFGIIVDTLSGRVNAFARFGIADSTTAESYADDQWHVHVVSMNANDTVTGKTVHRVDGVVANAGFTTGARPIATTDGARKPIIGATSADASAYPLTGQIAAAIAFSGIAMHQSPTLLASVERYLTVIKNGLTA